MVRHGMLFLSAALAVACTNSVVDEATNGTGPGGSGGDETSQGGSGASVPTNGGAGGCGIDCPPSYAIVYEQGTVGTGGGTSSSGQSVTASSTTGGGPSYEMVHLQLSDHGESCALASELLPCGGFTRYTLTLPKNMLTPGIVYLSHPDVWLSIEETLDADPNGDCGYGFGGGFENGQLEIFSVDQDKLVGALSGVEVFGAFDPNDQLIASLCF